MQIGQLSVRAADLFGRFAPSVRLIGLMTAIVALVVIARWPTTTRYGVNYHVLRMEIPLYEKALNFLSRDLQTRRFVRTITAGASGDREIVERLFGWVTKNIAPVPDGLPVIDDHAWNIVVRRYGADDQRTEAFAQLVSYGCCPAARVRLQAPGSAKALQVTAVALDGHARVFDVVYGVQFRNVAGEFATIEELMAHPDLIAAAVRGLHHQGLPYELYFQALPSQVLSFARTDAQKPWHRLRAELAKVTMLGR